MSLIRSRPDLNPDIYSGPVLTLTLTSIRQAVFTSTLTLIRVPSSAYPTLSFQFRRIVNPYLYLGLVITFILIDLDSWG